jgi:SWI/SNF-related matrix-associated actin-dependent regulator 1 of chromatin subfamily A
MPNWLHAIPGLRVDYNAGTIQGAPDALEAAGCNVHDIVSKYTPIELPPHPAIRGYQNKGAQWLLCTMNQYKGAILADDMGLGKTRTAIWTSQHIPYNNFTIIVAPANVAHQWKEECEKLGILNAQILGAKAKHKAQWASLKNSVGYYIVSPNLSSEALETAGSPPQCIILDEPHMYLRGRTGKWLWDLADHVKLINYRIACTGTPMYNTPRDLWSLLFLLFSMRFGKAKEFDARYCNGHEGTYGWVNDGASNLSELKKRLSHYMLRRTLEDVSLELPPITTSFRWVKSTPEAQAAMLQSHGSAQGVDGALDKCLNAKMDEVVSVALTLENPCVIWTYHPHHATQLAQLIEQSGKHCVPIHGGQSVAERHNLIKEAAAKGWSIAATIDAAGTGVNMQGVASTAIFHTIQRIPKKTHQAMKRLHRSGQQNPVHNIFIAMKDAMDEIVVDTVIKKLDYWNELMGEDDVEDNVGGAVRSNKETEDAILRAIYEEMQ